MRKSAPRFSASELSVPSATFLRLLRVYEFDLPSGKRGRWESLWSPKPTVLFVGFTPEEKMVLIHFFRFPIEGFVLDLPGGVLNENETPKQCATREFLEETGYTPESVEELTKFFIWNGKSNAEATIFVGRRCVKTTEPKREETEQYAQMEVAERFPREIIEGIANDKSGLYAPCIAVAITALLGRGVITYKQRGT